MKKRSIAILAVAAILVIGGIFVIAQRAAHRGFGDRGMHGGPGAMMMLKRLDLTSDQQAKVKEIFEANKGTVQPIREQLKANHEKLAALGGTFDEAQVTAIAKEQGDLMSQLIVARQKVRSQIFAILTDEQKAKAEQMRQEMKQRFQNRMKSFGRGQEKTQE
jgi:protein CpxP